MRTRRHRASRFWPRRSGTILVLTSLVLLTIVGMLGLVLDSGLLMSQYRQVQNSADAAALAAAQSLIDGKTETTARTVGTSFVTNYNGLGNATVTIRIPPTSGPYNANLKFAEAIVEFPIQTRLIQLLGGPASRTVSARAVAGYQAVSSSAGVIALDPEATPGFMAVGNGTFIIDGTGITNSEGGGVDENGDPVDGLNGYGAQVSGNGVIKGRLILVNGGVNRPDGFIQYDPANPDNPLVALAGLYPDPFRYLPTPTVSTGVDPTNRGSIKVSGENTNATFYPGVYSDIQVSSGTARLMPGIYVVKGGEVRITGGTVTAAGVMFYLTGSDYSPYTGLPDANDGEARPPHTTGNPFGGVTINSGAFLSPLANTGGPYDGMLIYHRRFNDSVIDVAGNAYDGLMTGTVYAKWSLLKLAGQGVFNTQFVVGQVTWRGNGTMILNYNGRTLAKGNMVFLVE